MLVMAGFPALKIKTICPILSLWREPNNPEPFFSLISPFRCANFHRLRFSICSQRAIGYFQVEPKNHFYRFESIEWDRTCNQMILPAKHMTLLPIKKVQILQIGNSKQIKNSVHTLVLYF